MLNGAAVAKANQGVRPGDIITVPQGPWQRTVEVLALGARRGPAVEAQELFREMGSVRRADALPAWEPLVLVDDDD